MPNIDIIFTYHKDSEDFKEVLPFLEELIDKNTLFMFEYGAVNLPPTQQFMCHQMGWPEEALKYMYEEYSKINDQLHELDHKKFSKVKEMGAQLEQLDFITLMNLYLLQENVDFIAEHSSYETFVDTVKAETNMKLYFMENIFRQINYFYI